MDNRLKFRAYVKSLKWMVPVERINFDCQTVEVDLTDGNGDTSEYDFDEIELMQCTGLIAAKSYRGDSEDDRLVFEGDIVTRRAPIYKIGQNEPEGEYQAMGTVVIREDGKEAPSYCVESHDHLGNETDVVLFVDNSGWHEGWYVIGNVHEHSELLDGEKED